MFVGQLVIPPSGTAGDVGLGASEAMNGVMKFDWEQVLEEEEAEELWIELYLPESNRCCLEKLHRPEEAVTKVVERLAAAAVLL
jgi:hypothetical protein